MQAVKIHRYTVAEYLALENEGEVRHEYIDGELFAMVGASRAHNLLATNLTIALGNHLEGTPCRVTQSDMKVWIEAANCFYYPDLMVCCEPVEDEPDDYYETRPRLIVEIQSPSTAQRDASEKRLNYQTLASLQEYLLLAQDQPAATLYRRQDTDWLRIELTADDELELAGLDFRQPLRALYRQAGATP